MAECLRAVTSLPPNDHSAARGRRFVRDVLVSCALADLVDTAVLLASELITNAVLHGRSEVELAVEIAQGEVTVSAADLNSRMPVMQSTDEFALDGRGLAIINLMASQWGVTATEDGKVVWFRLDLPEPEPAQLADLRREAAGSEFGLVR
ncbi:MAG: ATP-binding protein [Mycobacteriales bacterium]